MRRYRRKGRKTYNYNKIISLFAVLTVLAIMNTAGIKTQLQKMVMAEILPFVGSSKTNISYDKGILNNNQEDEPAFIDLIGIDDIEYQPETDKDLLHSSIMEEITEEEMNNLHNLDYLKNKFYVVDKRTQLTSADINVDEFLSKDLTFENKNDGPKVLIFHTHISEMYSDSDPSKGITEGVYGAGEKLKQELEFKYGIECLHDNGVYDMVNGRSARDGAYERMEPYIQKILDENPSIELVIDLHRDGVNDDVRLVKNINGKNYAKFMFFNGLCKLNQNGKLSAISNLPNPYVDDNLALSVNLQLAANKLYPEITRKIDINAYRYSLHMRPKSLLVELGAQTNTKEEAFNSMEALADIIASVVLDEE